LRQEYEQESERWLDDDFNFQFQRHHYATNLSFAMALVEGHKLREVADQIISLCEGEDILADMTAKELALSNRREELIESSRTADFYDRHEYDHYDEDGHLDGAKEDDEDHMAQLDHDDMDPEEEKREWAEQRANQPKVYSTEPMDGNFVMKEPSNAMSDAMLGNFVMKEPSNAMSDAMLKAFGVNRESKE
jgi:hypothetical protein